MNSNDSNAISDPKSDKQPIRKFGDNPNTRNAQHRKANRPKVESRPLTAKNEDISYKWCDPLPVVDPIQFDLEPHCTTLPSGYVTLRDDLPQAISDPFCTLLSSVLERTNLPESTIGYCANKLNAQGYFKAARQLYSTLTDPEKSKLQPLKTVFYDTTHIPSHMASALSIVGHFETKLGRVEVKDATVLFRRWTLQGLSIDPDTTAEIANPQDIFKYVWRDSASKVLIDKAAKKKLNELCNTVFQIQFDEFPFNVRVPEIPISHDGYTSITPNYPNFLALQRLVTILLMTNSQYITGEDLNGHSIADCLAEIDLLLVPDELEDYFIRNLFEIASTGYITKAKAHVESVLTTGESPTSGRGFPAQIVSSSNVTADFSLPLSDADRHLGFIFNPQASFEFNPQFVAYSKRSNKEAAANFAQRDSKTLAA